MYVLSWLEKLWCLRRCSKYRGVDGLRAICHTASDLCPVELEYFICAHLVVSKDQYRLNGQW